MKSARIFIMAIPLLASAQQPRRIGDDQPLPHRLSSLPIAQRHAIEAAIEPYIWDWLKDDDDADTIHDEIKAIERDMRYDRSTLGSRSVLLLHAYNTEGCGAVGNCHFFILDAHSRVLLYGVGKEYTVLPTAHNDLPDILIGVHHSADETGQHWYEFNGQRYKATHCATDNYGLPYTDGKLHRDSSPCD